jgi:hypothetical protein
MWNVALQAINHIIQETENQISFFENLRKFSLDLSVNLCSLPDSVPVISAYIRGKAETIRRFSEDIASEILPTLLNLRIEVSEVVRPMIESGNALTASLETAKTACEVKLLQFEAIVNLAKASIGDDRISLIKLAETCKQAKEIEIEYNQVVENLNTERESYSNKIQALVMSLDSIGLRHQTKLQDSIDKFRIFEIDSIKNSEYDLNISYKDRHVYDSTEPNESQMTEIPSFHPVSVKDMQVTDIDVVVSGDYETALLNIFTDRVVSEIDVSTFESLVSLTLSILDGCCDSINFKSVRSIFATAHKIKCSESKQSLLQAIYHHKIWDLVVLWEDMFSWCISEYFVLFVVHTSDYWRRFISLEIESFRSQASSFGVPSLTLDDIISRGIESHSGLLGDRKEEISKKLADKRAPKVSKPKHRS